jgi:hypothetical protein
VIVETKVDYAEKMLLNWKKAATAAAKESTAFPLLGQELADDPVLSKMDLFEFENKVRTIV